ncbi:MAG: ATP-binding cassette domain-containing protein [Promethearchaeota archaeon]
MKAIIVNDLSKYFSASKQEKKYNKARQLDTIIHAVDDINFEVMNGEIFGFLGPNGAGKTTTIRMLTGVLKPTKGNILIFGDNLWKNPIPIKQIMGNVPEEANVYIELSGWQNLILISEIYGISKKERIRQAETLLKKFELYEKRNLKAKKYSKGMKQRLLLCMALMSNPKILFLDEPLSGLDVVSGRIIKQLIKDYNKKGMTIFLTTHDMEVANELCHRIAIINHGKIISLDTPNHLKNLTQKYHAIEFDFIDSLFPKEIENLKNVIKIQEGNNGCRIIVKDVTKALFEIIDYIRSKNLTIKQINTFQPKLEDAFLEIIKKGGKN